jgi:hypothetical protein
MTPPRKRWHMVPGAAWELRTHDGVVVAQVSQLIGRYYYEVPGVPLMKTGWADTRHAAQLAVWRELRRRREREAA